MGVALIRTVLDLACRQVSVEPSSGSSRRTMSGWSRSIVASPYGRGEARCARRGFVAALAAVCRRGLAVSSPEQVPRDASGAHREQRQPQPHSTATRTRHATQCARHADP